MISSVRSAAISTRKKIASAATVLISDHECGNLPNTIFVEKCVSSWVRDHVDRRPSESLMTGEVALVCRLEMLLWRHCFHWDCLFCDRYLRRPPDCEFTKISLIRRFVVESGVDMPRNPIAEKVNYFSQ